MNSSRTLFIEMIPILEYANEPQRQRVEALLANLRLDPASIALSVEDADNRSVRSILDDVAKRGDRAIIDSARKFGDPSFSIEQLKVAPREMSDAAARLPAAQMAAIRRSIAQVREYQQHIMPEPHAPLRRPGVELGLRFTPLDSAGFYVPGGKAAYPSTLIMLAVPAQVAGVERVVACTPASRFGKSDLVLATAHELGLTDLYRAGGVAAIGAMAFGTQTIPAVHKIVGPGNRYVQLAKRALAGVVGIDGFLGPSEIVVIADDSAEPSFIAADLLAQAEHDPGSCFLITDSKRIADEVARQIEAQAEPLKRINPIRKALADGSAIIVTADLSQAIELANRFAAEHVNVQTRNDDAVVAQLRHGGAVFVGPYSPVAAGDYIAGPSHCLPTNTTARFSSGISVYEFLKRVSIERYDANGLAADASAIMTLADAEGLDAHAASVRIRSRS